jgi:DNA-binding CsgD family transcriptional regulator
VTEEAEALADRLAPRHRECLWHVFQLRTSKEIAGELGIGVGTVDSYISEAVAILGAPNRRRAAEMLFGGKNMTPPGKSGGELAGVAIGASDPPVPGQGLQVGEWQVLLPFRHKGVDRNALGPIHRLFWFILLVLAAAASFGMLAIGLEVLSRFFTGE